MKSKVVHLELNAKDGKVGLGWCWTYRTTTVQISVIGLIGADKIRRRLSLGVSSYLFLE